MNIPRNLKIKIVLIAIGVILIASGIFFAGTKFASDSEESETTTIYQDNKATESAKVKKDKKDDSKEEVKGVTTTTQTYTQPPTKTTTKPKSQNVNNTRKYLRMKFDVLLSGGE